MIISVHPTAKTAPQTATGWEQVDVKSMAELGQIVVDKAKRYQEELGQWNDPDSFIPV